MDEAKADPERVRHFTGYKPLHVFFNSPVAHVEWVDDEGARHCYTRAHADRRLRLVARPVEHRLYVYRCADGERIFADPKRTVGLHWGQNFAPSAVRLEADGTIVVTE